MTIPTKSDGNKLTAAEVNELEARLADVETTTQALEATVTGQDEDSTLLATRLSAVDGGTTNAGDTIQALEARVVVEEAATVAADARLDAVDGGSAFDDALGSLGTRVTNLNVVNVIDYGADPTGATDSTTACQTAIDAAVTQGKVVLFNGTFKVSSLQLKTNTLAAGAKFTWGGTGANVVNIATANIRVDFLNVNGSAGHVTGVKVTANDVAIDAIRVRSIRSISGGATIYGVEVVGNDVRIGTVDIHDCLNTSHSNESVPQAIGLAGDAAFIADAFINDSTSGVVTTATNVSSYVASLRCVNLTDNGIYHLAGELHVGTFMYEGAEEAAVSQSNLRVDVMSVRGGGSSAISMDNAGDVYVGSLNLSVNGTDSPLNVARTRSGNTASGRLTIGKLTGEIRGDAMFDIRTGTTEYVSILGGHLRFIYDATRAPVISRWMDLIGSAGVLIQDLAVDIIDEDGILTSEIFWMTLGTLTEASEITNLDIRFKTTAGVEITGPNFRSLAAVSNMRVTGAVWQNNIGPYIRERNAYNGVRNGTNVIPTLGTWRLGQRLWNATPTAGGPDGWVCTTAGTPGTWKVFGTISA